MNYTCFDKKGFKIDFIPSRESETLISLKALFSSTTNQEISNIVMQVAVPKTLNVSVTFIMPCTPYDCPPTPAVRTMFVAKI